MSSLELTKPNLGTDGNDNITDDVIVYQDKHCCILKPNCGKGIIVCTRISRDKKDIIYKEGLKSAEQMNKEGILFGREVCHSSIFFIAPQFANPIDRTSIYTEISSSYNDIDICDKVFIRIDPEKTYTFSSEIRTKSEYHGRYNIVIQNSKKTVSDYLKVIKHNKTIVDNKHPALKVIYNMFSSQAYAVGNHVPQNVPYDDAYINYNSEILVTTPILLPQYFVNV